MSHPQMRVLIVGGGRGIGRSVAEGFAKSGASMAVGVMGRNPDPLNVTVEMLHEFEARAWSLPGDVLNGESVCEVVTKFVELAGGLDVVVYAAGRFRGVGPLVTVAADDWWADVETTLRGFANVVRETVPHLRRSQNPSLIALIGPGHARELAFGAGYGCAQAGLARLVESLDVELRPDKIPVYAVNPGLVPTPLINHILDSSEGRKWLKQFTEAFAEGKEVGPEVATETILWLADTRPTALSGRVVASLLSPVILAARLERIVAEDRGKLRIT